MTVQGTDFLTKVEFSRRGFGGGVLVEPVSNSILRTYKFPPLIVPHYSIVSAISQKICALATRTICQARDVFDLYLLSTQYNPGEGEELGIGDAKLQTAISNVYDISFARFRDTVLAYLSVEDQAVYGSSGQWDEIRLKVADFIKEFNKEHD